MLSLRECVVNCYPLEIWNMHDDRKLQTILLKSFDIMPDHYGNFH